MPSFEDALALAARAHKGQYDLAGAPYICHPMRVALAQTDERARIVAILHDVVEDTPITYDDLAHAGFDADIIAAVDPEVTFIEVPCIDPAETNAAGSSQTNP